MLLTIFQKVCDGLAFAHSKSVIHRDLKPENIMVGDYGEVLVMDWGLAKRLRNAEPQGPEPGERDIRTIRHTVAEEMPASAVFDPATLASTMAGAIMGTPQYMAPEQARGEIETMDQRADIYALGAILYHILALRPAVTGKDSMEVVGKVARGEIEPLQVLAQKRKDAKNDKGSDSESSPFASSRLCASHLPGGRIPDSLAAVVRKAMSLDKTTRYRSVEDLQADILAYQTGFATSAENAGAWKQFTLLVKRNKAASIGIAAVLLVGGVLGTKTILEGNRAKREAVRAELGEQRALRGEAEARATLGELRGTAPTFEAQSRALLGEGELDDALAKIGYAVNLAPENADYHIARANLFQSTQRLSEAVTEYRQVLALRPGDATAQMNLDLCANLLAERGSAAELPMKLQGKLLNALIAQHRDLEAAPLAKLLGRDMQTAEATIRARLASYTTQTGWNKDNIQRSGKGFIVNLEGKQLGDLNALRDLPIVELSLLNTSVSDLRAIAGPSLEALNLNGTRVSDLSPLRGMKLRKLSIRATRVNDLSPLVGMPLKELNIGWCGNLHDLKPLVGLPLEILNLSNLPILDISSLRGMPLRTVILRDCKNVVDFSPLAHSVTLEAISLPWEIMDIAFLHTLPQLQKVDFRPYSTTPERWIPASKFLGMYDPEVPEIKAARAALATVGVKDLAIRKVSLDPDRRLQLDLAQTSITDLTPLRGLPISDLNLKQTAVRNLKPLQGMPLARLSLLMTPVQDLSPLRELPLVHLWISHTKVSDVSPLLDCPKLTSLVVGSGIKNLEVLRQHPALLYLSYNYDETNQRADKPVKDFWAEYDARTPLQVAREKITAALPALGMAAGKATIVEPWGVRLIIEKLPVTDIRGLRPLPIDALSLFETKVADLAPLRGMRLKELSFAKTDVKDVSPLLDMPILEAAMVTQGATNLGVLRQHPTLKWLGWEGDWDAAANRPKLTIAEFWARYDEQQAAQKK